MGQEVPGVLMRKAEIYGNWGCTRVDMHFGVLTLSGLQPTWTIPCTTRPVGSTRDRHGWDCEEDRHIFQPISLIFPAS
jgi:hypothetical protein